MKLEIGRKVFQIFYKRNTKIYYEWKDISAVLVVTFLNELICKEIFGTWFSYHSKEYHC